MTKNEENDDGPPPLEDLSHIIKQKLQVKENPAAYTAKKSAPLSKPLKQTQSSDLLDLSRQKNSALLVDVKQETRENKKSVKIEEMPSSGGGQGAFGFKKGFLSSTSAATKTSAPAPPLYAETEKPAAPLKKNNPEIEKLLAEHLGDGWEKDQEFYDAIELFSNDPEKALKKYGDNQKVVQCLLAVASKLMPQAFNRQPMAPSDNSGSGNSSSGKIEELVIPSSTGGSSKNRSGNIRLTDSIESDQLAKRVDIPADLPDHEKELIKRVMADPLAQTALRDPEVQQYMARLQQDPRLQFQQPPTHLRDRLKRLVDIGILQMSRK